MYKVQVPINCCNIGDVLADDVYNDRGAKLVRKNTIINQYIKDKLIEMGISTVWTYQSVNTPHSQAKDVNYEIIKENYHVVVLTIKEVLNKLASGEQIEYDKIVDISKLIFSTVNESRSVIRFLAEIRNTDEYTYTHCVDTAFYSMLIAKWLKLSENQIQEVIQAGLLHDIGKVRIPNEILNKKGKLTVEEFEVIKKHSLYGYELIKDIYDFGDSVKNGVLMHHERLDGSGYPYGIRGDAIDLYAKIIAVADVYDAMTRDRVYKKKATPFEVFQMFSTTGLGTFDTIVLNSFLNNMPVFYIGSNVELNNGEVGEIVYIPPQDIASPIVRVDRRYYDLSNMHELRVLSIL